MIWAVIYIAGAGVFSWFAYPWLLGQFAVSSRRPDDMEQWTTIAFTLLMSAFWPFFALIGAILIVAKEGETKRRIK